MEAIVNFQTQIGAKIRILDPRLLRLKFQNVAMLSKGIMSVRNIGAKWWIVEPVKMEYLRARVPKKMKNSLWSSNLKNIQ